jgi:hypothetical protein
VIAGSSSRTSVLDFTKLAGGRPNPRRLQGSGEIEADSMRDETQKDALKLVADGVAQPGAGAVALRDEGDPAGGRHDVDRLETRIRYLRHSLSVLADHKSFETLIRLIHQPGYTTAAEFELVSGLIESMHDQANTLAELALLVVTASHTIVGD